MAKFTLKLRTWIPASRVLFLDSSVSKVEYGGDGRSESWSGTHRTQQTITVDTAPTNYSVSVTPNIGTTYKYITTKATGKVETQTGKAPTSDLTYSNKRVEGDILYFDVACASANPLQVGAPDVNYEFTIKVTRGGIMRLTGKHDGFPGYELWRQNDGGTARLLWSHDPRDTGEGLGSLYPPMEHDVDENLGS